MLRGWTLAIVGVSTLFASSASAQPAGGVSLAERLGLVNNADADDAPTMHDSQVRPAAVAAENRPRSPKEAGNSPTTKRAPSGGGLFSRIKLPNLMPGSSSQQQQLANPPVAYDPADSSDSDEATQPHVQTQVPPQARANPAGQAPVRRPSATASTPQRRTTSNPATTAGAPRVAAPRTTTPQATTPAAPRVARSSPRMDNRHNELADALTGLRAADADDNAGNEAATTDAPAEDAGNDVALPAADGGEAAPSYLNDEVGADVETNSAAPSQRSTTRGTSARSTASGPVDVREALLGPDNATSSTPATRAPRTSAPARTTAPAPTSTPARRTAPAPTVRRSTTQPAGQPVGQSATQSAAPVRRSQTAPPVVIPEISEEPQVEAVAEPAAPVDNAGAALGGIVAEPAPPAFRSTPTPTPTAPTTILSPPRTTTPVVKPGAVVPVPASIGNLRPNRNVLLSCKAPVIVSSVSGPQQIVVGRTAEYKVLLENKGEEIARDMVATIAVPTWADVVDAAATNGAVERPAAIEGGPHTIQWRLYELAAGASQTLTLQLVPRSGRSLQLAVKCEQAPASAEVTVDVQEPKLQMDITGPSEVVFGKSQRYTLILSNPGSGNADDVVIELVPPGGDPKAPVRHKVGALAAGASKTIELELTAREAGDLKMQATATAAGELRIEAMKTVLCRKAELDVDWRGPDKNFAGAVATYYIRVRNPGTAAADKVAVELTLPAGAELIDASAGHSWDVNRHTVVWQPGAIGSSEERFMQIRCKHSKPGINQMELVARTAAGDLSDVQSVPVTIEALADLKLQVSDPQGVVPVGETGVYEIHVQNRGQIAARGVNVIAMFSEGLEPSHVEGGQHDIRDGRVAFRTIDTLPAGAEVVLRIHAKASQPGTHVFRTEVVCGDLETKLVAEETTRFFVEEERWADASSAYSDKGDATTR